MSDIWEGAIWNKNGELVANIYKEPPRHTYKEIDCGGECGGCVALVVDGQVVSGPPFHKHCKCSLPQSKIDAAIEQESNMNNIVAPDRNSESADVKWLKDALLQLGFYEPDIRAGETENSINEYPNQNLFNAINKFQREHNLSERGSVAPGHQTEAKINRELKEQTKLPKEDFVYNGNTFSGPIGIIDKQYALFNGTSLSVYEDDKKIAEWPAVSGRPGHQSSKYQKEKDLGPIPEGVYVIRKQRLQFYNDISWWDRQRSAVGLGTWRGGTDSWGESRVWLEPAKETNLYGRSGFSIHGGAVPGSAGCIDLTHSMDGFTKWFENNKKDVILKVKY